ncbi:Putative transcriptional regulator DJ-1 [Plasmopara halstedii]|uniref:Putative transcriptional regulator DJ-1 n=1 Tax=Plasmopara halstedii TaxID=4781 RepID=A0A0P1AAM9_PLAHL|nr:Putative transcriptional regulator DJ-1 [Plasmopara halstedii]CEG37840.1 Putative transcriptional regulator DJ-1 [Plasmopara halstedii]|eukprot:XP_024574209.1 Putative transcriptional regulator DJ-1 [Plasmopara halstedii]
MSTVEGEPRTVMIPIADGTEEIEAIGIADVLTRGGMMVTLASIGRKLQNIVTMSQGTKVQGDIAIEACTELSFDLIMCPGGPGAQHLHDSSELIKMLTKQKHQGRYYGGICAAPAVVLLPHGLLDTGPATAYPSYATKMTMVDYKPNERVVVNGKCITSQGPGTAIEMGLKLVELLCSKEKAKDVAQALVT